MRNREIIRARAPLRLGLAGGGTDLSPFCDAFGGQVLNATVNLHAYAHIESAGDGQVAFDARDLGETFAAQAAPRLPPTGPLALHKAVYNRVVRTFRDGMPLALRMTTHCDAPPGSGLGSSSTLVVAMLAAYAEWLRLPLGEYDLAQLAWTIERRDLGLSGGRQDQYAATFGGFNFMEFHAGERVIVNPLRIKGWIVSELEASLVLFHTGASRASAAIIDAQTRNVEARDNAAVDAMHALKSDAVGMKEALLRGDFARFATLLARGWEAKKRTAAPVTNERIETAFAVATEAGAVAGKVSGAGGGGFCMFVTDPRRKPEVVRALSRLEGAVVPCHFHERGAESWRLG
jgi:D-glycero-alpha-D-manno-heptose-7-phosphate kinase